MRQNRHCLHVFGVQKGVEFKFPKSTIAGAEAGVTFFGTGAGGKKVTPNTSVLQYTFKQSHSHTNVLTATRFSGELPDMAKVVLMV